MAILIMISKHTVADCAIHNEKMRKTWNQIYANMPQLLKKHGIKNVGAWAVMSEHTMYFVFDAPTLEAWQKYVMEPDMMTWLGTNMTQIKMAAPVEQAAKTVQ
jgi:L-rhamnose mutarotase